MQAAEHSAYDLLLPNKPNSKGPLLVFVHGGAWISGGRQAYQGLAQGFADRGIATALVSYRLSNSPAVQHPVHAQDVANAIAALVKAPKGFDPKRVFISGHSAGAHIAATIATDASILAKAKAPKGWKPAGYIGLEGIYDLPALDKRWPAYRSWFLERAFGDPSKWKQASPSLRKVVHRGSWLVVHSLQDELVDVDQSKAFAKRLQAQAVPVRLLTVNRGSHFDIVQQFGKAGEVTEAAVAFVNRRPR
jgi:acetyl esterase/lipase